MRRLPVYLLVDTSGSMMGEAIEAVRNGLQMLVSALRQDPYALETAYLSVITFDSHAKQVTPLTELMSFQMPDIQASGVTAMGEALTLLADCINREVQKAQQKSKAIGNLLYFYFQTDYQQMIYKKGSMLFAK
ncbi:VWA domain-containing protein [Glaesserella parasuis]|nr:VWA domain-containing protein [Glaesserella parasuis]MDG6450621.1 VWA domain-containing protein [Glaesserella parasuis]MDO9791672.1 VWA domain-containing protein [Glaesserella parasuis]MDO9798478.1 VWA domain-containing protein [Glaesserella parasuis]MDO9850007.1 VWA domain-containing protein [Glaesserella parasuis]MDO9863515.1 VWA domain-containing protein [Glaesserella parasuis]